MAKVIASLAENLKTLRSGRASPALVEDITISYYGTPTPLKHVASITLSGPKLIVIAPWDKSILTEIENSIRLADIGINPINDGQVVRVAIPSLTEENRKELVKKLHLAVEEVRVALRTIRRDAWDEIQEMERGGKISEDDRYAAEKELNKLIEEMNGQVDDMTETKEKEIMTI